MALSYVGRKGTGFALPSRAAMAADGPVIVAAPGTVRGVRDGMPDRICTDDMKDAKEGRDCDNGVVTDHGDGWET